MRFKLVFAATLLPLLTGFSGCKKKNRPQPQPDKPIIYLYPEEVTEVSVSFADEDSVETTHTYPEYGDDGWNVIAHPDGTLFDPETDDEFYALYWEGITDHPGRLRTGSVVSDDDLVSFLEDSLDELGLTPRESNEFIIYWAPILEESRFNFVHFATDAWDEQVPLDISPEPDSLLRVMMYYRPARPTLKVEAQVFKTPERDGFTAVEWGGAFLPR